MNNEQTRLNQAQDIQTSLDVLFETAKEYSKNAIFNNGIDVDYAYVTGFYESAFSNMLRDMNLTKKQLDILTNRCAIK